MTTDVFAEITATLVAGDPAGTVAATRRALESGCEPLAIIDRGLVPGMKIVGQKFACGEYFLPNLIVAAAGMKQSMQLLTPVLHERNQSLRAVGTVVIGTVKGDIHEIGKSLVATMLSANGFEVHDLGVDVPIDTFVAKVRETGATILGLSALLTTTMTVQKKVIEALIAAGLRGQVKVIVGGAPVTRRWADEIGADGYAEDAVGAVQLASQLATATAA